MNLKTVALNAIASAIAAQVPALQAARKAAGGHDDIEDKSIWPALRVVPAGPFQFVSAAPEIKSDEETDAFALYDVGTFEGDIALRLYCRSERERDDLEEAVLSIFLGSNELAPGSLDLLSPTLTLNGIVTLYQAPITVLLEREDWNDEKVFDRKRFSFLECSLSYPALVAKAGIPTITTLQIGFAESLTATVPDFLITVPEG